MQLLSISFLIFFLPACLVLYWKFIKTPRSRLWFLLAASLLFYSLGGIQFIPLLLALSLATYWLAQRKLIWPGVCLNLLALVVFKYWDFGITNLQNVIDQFDIPFVLPLLRLAFPLGLSYYVFKHLGYLFDIQKGRYEATTDRLTFITYSVFFPQISAGPISSFQDTGKQLGNLPTSFSYDMGYQGLLHLAVGIAKKLLLAENIAIILGMRIFETEYLPDGLAVAWVLVLLQGFFLYLDFSGYTDMALGLGYLFGVTLPPNFDNPYTATSPRRFWERWHISLTQWFRIYLFSPLSRFLIQRWGATRKTIAQYTANIVTMTLVGLWHGASAWFVLWGVYHGVLLNINAWAERKRLRVVGSWISQVATFIAVMFGWSFFFSSGKGTFLIIFRNLVGLGGFGSFSDFFAELPANYHVMLIVTVLVIFSGYAEAANLSKIKKPWFAALVGILLAIPLMFLGEPSDFSYVQF